MKQHRRSTTEYLRRVPGFTRVESSGGEVNQNLSVRGLLSVQNVSIQEDGMMVFPSMDILFMNADNLIRPDENLQEIEVLVGGTTPIFGASTAGATVNLLNKTGGSELHGVWKGTAGTSGLGRVDMNMNGPLSDDWRFNIGGFYRYDHGVRDPGYPGTRGGQLKASVTRILSNGFFRLSIKHIDDKNLFILPLPFQNPDDPDYVEGCSDTGSFYSEEGITEIPLPTGKDLRMQLDDGIHTKATFLTSQFNFKFGNDWQFENMSQVMSVDHNWNALVPLELLNANEYANHVIDSYIDEKLVPRGTTYQLLFTNHFDAAGNKLPFDTANGLLAEALMVHVEKPVSDFSNLLTLKKFFGPHNFSLGTYFAYCEQGTTLYFMRNLTDVRDNPRFLDLVLIQPDGSTVDVTKNGFNHFIDQSLKGRGNNTLIAFFATDEFKLSERLRIDLGFRYELANYFQVVENTTEIDLDHDERTLYDIETWGDRTFRQFNFNIDDIAYSTGVNYQIRPNQLAIYGSFTHGFKLPALDQFLLEANEEFIKLIKPYTTNMFETGIKYSGPYVGFAGDFFYGRVYNQIGRDSLPDPVTHEHVFFSFPIPDNSGWGFEFEVFTKPTKQIELRSSATLVKIDVPEVNQGGQFYDGFTPAVLDFEGSYIIHQNIRLMFDWHYVGERFSDSDLTVRLPNFSYINLSASYKFQKPGFSITSRILNLTQSKGLEEGNPRLDPTLGALGNVFLARPILPRRITVEARHEF